MRTLTFTAFIVLLTLATSAGAVCTPVLQWSWSVDDRTVCATPLVVQLTDDNGDSKIDGCDNPEIVFISLADGVVHVTALDGETGSERWTYVDRVGVIYSRFSMSAGDIDGDGFVEIITGGSGYITVLSHEGLLKDAYPISFSRHGDVSSIADIDGDGNPEILLDEQVYSSSGVWLWSGLLDNDDSKAVDVLPSRPGLEVLMGMDFLYDSSGTELWRFPSSTRDGYSAVADLDRDGVVDIIGVNDEGIHVIDELGVLRGSPFPLLTTRFSRPLIADVTGDGSPDVVVADGSYLLAITWDGAAWTELWRTMVNDTTGNPATPTGYDFDGDGASEVVHHDNEEWHLIDGLTGAILFSFPSESITVNDASVIVDVDNDGLTEIVVPSCDLGSFEVTAGLLVYECSEPGVPARAMWNEIQYHRTNVRNDGSIPTFEEPSWMTHNTWRSQMAAGPCAEICEVGDLPEAERLLVVKVGTDDVRFQWGPVDLPYGDVWRVDKKGDLASPPEDGLLVGSGPRSYLSDGEISGPPTSFFRVTEACP